MPQTLQKSYPSDSFDVFALPSPSIDAFAAYDAMHDALSTLKAAYLRRILYVDHRDTELQYEVRIAQLEQIHRDIDVTDVKGLFRVARNATEELASIGGLGGAETR